MQVTRVYGADAAPAVKRPRRMRDDGDGAASTEPPAPAVPVPRAPPPSMAATTSTTSTASAFQAYSTGRLSSPILPVPPSLLNIGQRMTAGLALCYAAISLRRTHDKKASAQDEHPPTRTDDEGNFLLPPTPPSTSISQAGVDDPEGRYWPWFAGRFRYESLLGVGAFAQTVRAEDMYHPARRRVAIKVQNRLYNVVGEEVTCYC